MSKPDCTTYCIYRIVCFITCTIYIGQTLDFTKRKQRHISALKRNRHENRHLQSDFNLYGHQSFYFEVIETDIQKCDIDQREKYWITYYDSQFKGYNKTSGGSVLQCHGNNVACRWNGIEYQSISQAARANGIKSDTLQARLKAGYNSDADMQKVHSKICVWNGIEYNSLSEAAKANNISAATLQERLSKGYTSNKDMNRVHVRKCTWNGVEYSSYTAAAKANGVSTHTIRWRILQGYTCDNDMK